MKPPVLLLLLVTATLARYGDSDRDRERYRYGNGYGDRYGDCYDNQYNEKIVSFRSKDCDHACAGIDEDKSTWKERDGRVYKTVDISKCPGSVTSPIITFHMIKCDTRFRLKTVNHRSGTHSFTIETACTASKFDVTRCSVLWLRCDD